MTCLSPFCYLAYRQYNIAYLLLTNRDRYSIMRLSRRHAVFLLSGLRTFSEQLPTITLSLSKGYLLRGEAAKLMKNTIKKIAVWRLILAVVLLTSLPAQASAAWTDTLGNWLKDNISSIAWAQKTDVGTVNTLATVNSTALMSTHQPLIGIVKVYEIFVTGYSSSEDETDSTPFITASGETVRDGIVATNFLPLNTKIKIPEIFGSKIFVVKDRMNRRFTDKMDIWFSSKDLAKQFGKKKLEVQVIEETI